MIKEIIKAFLLIFISEMGDKTQIIAMTFATKYKVRDVLLGVILGVFLNHGLAIVLGRFILNFIPLIYIQLISGLVFILFGYLSLSDDEDEDDEKVRNYGPIITVAIAFFLGELGDKTQLMAMTLATDAKFPLFILVGTTMGMVATSGLGIYVGSKIGDKIPDIYIKLTSSIVFLIFGSIKVLSNLHMKYSIPVVVIGIIIEIILIIKFIRFRRGIDKSAIQIAAEKLYKETNIVKESIDNICLGEEKCGKCDGNNCFLGYIRNMLNMARDLDDYDVEDVKVISDLSCKDYDKDKVIMALAIILNSHYNNNWPKEETFIINRIRMYLEQYLFNQSIQSDVDSKEYFREIRGMNDKYALRLEKILKGLDKK